MRVTVAIDSFKGSLSSARAGEAVALGVKAVYKDAVVDVCELADGGEGTTSALVSAMQGSWRTVEVLNPLGRKINASYGIIPEKQTAVLEMSAAAGITLIEQNERNPLYTTTFGVGEMILDAIEQGCRKFIVGIGGSATNDGGIGMLQALGFSFLDKEGKEVPLGGIGLKDIASIKTDKAKKELNECIFLVACDVKNPLCGEKGCSFVYGKQKGGNQETLEKMDEWLRKYAELTKAVNPQSDVNAEGAGAAGGMGFAFLAYLPSQMQSGIELVIRETGLEKYIEKADIVVTGEGRLDNQSVMGKAPVGVAKLAKKHQKPVLAFAGCVTDEAAICNQHGIDAFFPILRSVCTLEEAMNEENAFKNLKATAEQAFRCVKIWGNNDK